MAFSHDEKKLYVVANLCFGGPKNSRLYMASSRSVYALYVEAHGPV